jgi:hypothetical protein
MDEQARYMHEVLVRRLLIAKRLAVKTKGCFVPEIHVSRLTMERRKIYASYLVNRGHRTDMWRCNL